MRIFKSGRAQWGMELRENLWWMSTAPVTGKGIVLMIYMNKKRQLHNCQNYTGVKSWKEIVRKAQEYQTFKMANWKSPFLPDFMEYIKESGNNLWENVQCPHLFFRSKDYACSHSLCWDLGLQKALTCGTDFQIVPEHVSNFRGTWAIAENLAHD